MSGGAATTWTPVDLARVVSRGDSLEPPPSMLVRSDGESLLYKGKIHGFAGEPESAKGWLLLWASVERIRVGEHVLYIDFEDEATTVVSRLLALGLDGESIRNVRILERFALVEVPAGDAARVVERVTSVHGHPVALEPIRT